MGSGVKVLLVHNYYQLSGGEDQVFLAEQHLLEERDVEVLTYTASNDVIDDQSRLKSAANTLWNRGAARELAELVRTHAVDVVHFHNTFPIISPAAYGAVRAAGAAVVQTLHNYRLLCANALFFRDGHVCEDCLGKTPAWPAVQHACYRDSRAASGVVVAMQTVHRLRHTYERDVDAYIALTDFGRRKFIEGGLPADKLIVKPNFVARDPGMGRGEGGYALFVGRLVPEKGLETLLEAWKTLGERIPLNIAGTGPLEARVVRAAETLPGVAYLGQQDHGRVLDLMANARMLIFPSVVYETFGLTLSETFAVGTPAVASNLGAPASIVEHGRTGLHFEAGNAADLVAQVERLLARPQELANMRLEARRDYLAKYSAEANFRQLMDVYALALGRRQTSDVETGRA